MSWRRVVRLQDIAPGTMHAAEIAGEPLVVCRLSQGEIYAVEDCCSHADAPLSNGTLSDHVLECPLHGGSFDVRTGEALRLPAAAPINTFPARVSGDGWIEVDPEED